MMTRKLRVLITSSLVIATIWYLSGGIGLRQYHPPQALPGTYHRNAIEHINFWRQFQSLLMEHEPKCAPPRRLGNAPSSGFKASNPDPRPELLKMTTGDVLRMKKAHIEFVDAITTDPPRLAYIPGTIGIVTTAGGAYLPVLVISLRMLRRTGSHLPVEVFLATRDEYEEYICNTILPSLDAKCTVLSDVLDAVPKSNKIQKYQLKPFAMIFSSFEEILFLDADAFPIVEPELLFEKSPFKDTKFVTWPDFWSSTASPFYYEISSQQIPPMDSRQTTKSGEVVISKKTHLRTLLLPTYYNFWGPTHYYRLLTQGASGEGDKETFIAAAMSLGEPFYQVSERICAMGHRTESGFAGSAMAQFDPIEDYKLTQQGEWRVNGSKAIQPRPFFIHANVPKFNPATAFQKQDVNPAFLDDGNYARAWTIPEEMIEAFPVDVEKQFWADILWTGCELETKFESWKNKTDICNGVRKYWNALFGPEDPATV